MLADELDAPITLSIAGQTVKLGILDLMDLAEIQREIRQEAIDEAIAELPNSATAAEHAAIRRNTGKLSIEGLAAAVFALNGTPRFLRHELIKGGSAASDEEADKLIAKMARAKGWRELAYLAGEASGLFPPKEEEATEGNKDPNQQAGSPPATT